MKRIRSPFSKRRGICIINLLFDVQNVLKNVCLFYNEKLTRNNVVHFSLGKVTHIYGN